MFTEIYTEVIQEEREFIQSFFKESQDLDVRETLYKFLMQVKSRAHEKLNSKFSQYLSYSAPLEIESFITAHYFLYFDSLKNEIRKLFEKEAFRFTPDECTLSFIVLFDGLIIHLLYNTKQSFEFSLDVAFKVFWNGIQA